MYTVKQYNRYGDLQGNLGRYKCDILVCCNRTCSCILYIISFVIVYVWNYRISTQHFVLKFQTRPFMWYCTITYCFAVIIGGIFISPFMFVGWLLLTTQSDNQHSTNQIFYCQAYQNIIYYVLLWIMQQAEFSHWLFWLVIGVDSDWLCIDCVHKVALLGSPVTPKAQHLQ